MVQIFTIRLIWLFMNKPPAICTWINNVHNFNHRVHIVSPKGGE